MTADNPMNTANCTPGGSRQLLLPPQTGSNDGNNGGTLRAPPRLLLPTDVSSVNVTCTVPLRGPRLNASTVVTDLMAAPPASFVAVTALVAAQPALLGAGAPLGGGLFVSGTAVFAVPPTASATATATSSASSVPSPAISAPAFVVGTVTSSSALTPQGAAILGGTIVAVVVLLAACVFMVLALGGRRKRAVNDQDRVAASTGAEAGDHRMMR